MLRAPVQCADQEWGELRDLVIDPASNSVTHLVIEPSHMPANARIVPIGLARAGGSESVLRLACTVAEAESQPLAEVLAYSHGGRLSSDDPDWDVGASDTIEMPYQDGGPFVDYSPQPDPRIMMSYDRVPKGTVEIRRMSSVTTADGHIAGRLEGVIVDGRKITHIVLLRAYLWRRREISVPIEAVSQIATDDVSLTLSRRELGTRQ
jgi:uncharacterized protein YrrD